VWTGIRYTIAHSVRLRNSTGTGDGVADELGCRENGLLSQLLYAAEIFPEPELENALKITSTTFLRSQNLVQ
jgi:hypothetical protein